MIFNLVVALPRICAHTRARNQVAFFFVKRKDQFKSVIFVAGRFNIVTKCVGRLTRQTVTKRLSFVCLLRSFLLRRSAWRRTFSGSLREGREFPGVEDKSTTTATTTTNLSKKEPKENTSFSLFSDPFQVPLKIFSSLAQTQIESADSSRACGRADLQTKSKPLE